MSIFNCPGMERMRVAFPDEIPCACGEKVEMWPDDFEVRCPACGRTVERKAPPACVEWCAAARECVGESLYEKYMRAGKKRNKESLKNKLLDAMRNHFGSDIKRIRHAEKVAGFAEEIMKKEKGHYDVVMASSVLHDIGILEAERKYGSAKAGYQEKEGPPIARSILKKLGIDEQVIKEACDIIGHHHSPREKETINFRIVYDADMIANLLEEMGTRKETKDWKDIQSSFLTLTGREAARRLLE